MATVAGITYQQQKRKCGKKDCSKCPHGPYWYAFWRDGIGRQHSKYVGKELPADVKHVVRCFEDAPTLTQEQLDWLTLGVIQGTSFTTARTCYRNIIHALKIQWQNANGLEGQREVSEEIAAVRLAFKRLFPNRR